MVSMGTGLGRLNFRREKVDTLILGIREKCKSFLKETPGGEVPPMDSNRRELQQ